MDNRSQCPAIAGKLAFLALSTALGGAASAQVPLLELEILYEIDGDSQGDLLGASTAGLGDINGDGIGDFVVGIQREDPSGIANAGTARVFSGADGSVIYSFEGITQGGFFGNEVRCAGDVNADGTPDIIVGALFDDRGGLNRSGSATVFSGADGTVLYLFEGTELQGLMGRSVNGAGDVNGDGNDDLIVGLTDDRNGTDSGSIKVFSGADGSLLYDILGDAANDAFGASVSGLGDIDGDGFDDFAAGSRNATVGLFHSGQVRVFSGQTGSVLYTYSGSAADAIMHVVACAGDVDGDAVPDYLIGSPGADEAQLYSGADGSVIYSYAGNSSGDGFGSRLAGAGDVNHDGYRDVIIAAPADDRNGTSAGSVTVYSGLDSSVLFTLDGDPGDQLGSGVGGLGNVNGDACDDFIVGAFFDDNTFTNSGSAKILVVSGAACELDTSAPVVTITAPADQLVVGALSVLLEATIVDDSATEVSTDPASSTELFPAGGGAISVVVDLLVEGYNDLVVSAVDSAGNVGGTAVSVLRDTTAPTVTLVSPVAGAVLGDASVVMTLQIDDVTATNVSFGTNLLSTPRGGGALSGNVDLVEGENLVEVTVVDEAGNVTQLSVALTVDLTAPLVTIDSPLDSECFGAGQQTVVVSASVDDLTETTIITNSAGMAPSLPAGGGLLTGTLALSEGWNQLSVAATDGAGRVSVALVSVLLDTTGPAVSLDSLDADVPVAGEIDLSASAIDVLPGTGVVSVEFLVDGAALLTFLAAPYEAIYDTATLADGLHAFSVVAVDGKGNSSTSVVTVLVDNTAPEIAFTTLEFGQYVMGVMPFELAASDLGSGLVEVSVRVAGQSPTVDPSAIFAMAQASAVLLGEQDTIPLPDGQLILDAVAWDAAGNETIIHVSVVVDNTAPQKFLSSPTDGAVVSGVIEILVEGLEANLDRIEVFVNNVLIGTSTASPYSLMLDTTTLLDGVATVTAVAYDLAGNVSNCSAGIVIDNTQFRMTPTTLFLRSRGKSVTGRVTGPDLGLLLPIEAHQIELRVPGGSAVPATIGWSGDDAVTVDEDGERLMIHFDRAALSSSIQAGIAAGQISSSNPRVPISLWVDGRELGTTIVRVKR